MEYIAAHMRKADAMEVEAGCGLSPHGILSHAVERPGTLCLHDGPVPVAMFGCPDAGDGVGVPWLLGTDALTRSEVTFLRWSQSVVDLWSSQYELLMNYTDARHTESHQWLAWLGFTLDTTPVHFNDSPFFRFSKVNKPCASI